MAQAVRCVNMQEIIPCSTKKNYEILLDRESVPMPQWLICIAVLLALAMASRARDLYVSPSGSDRNPGDASRPLATWEKARDLLREWRSRGVLRDSAVTVWIEPGVYQRSQPFELTGEDSGTADAPVVWRARRPFTARLSGGVRLSGFHPVDDPAVLQRLQPEARRHVMAVDVRALTTAYTATLSPRGFGRPTIPAHCELFVDWKPMTLARWPNEGEFALIAQPPRPQTDEHGGQLGALEEGFHYSGDRPTRWQPRDDWWIHGYWAYDWANSYERITKLDASTRLIQTAPPYGWYGFRAGQRFFFLNILEELDQPGEWYLDRQTGRLYFWPPDGTRLSGPESSDIVLSVLDAPLIRCNEVSHVSFHGLTLEAGRADAVQITGGAEVALVNCRIRCMGNWGVTVNGGLKHRVAGCDVLDTGDGGVSITGGDRTTLSPGGHVVEGCHFVRQGRWSKCYVPAVLMNGVGLRVSHCLIEQHPHCAILYGGNDHLIEYNEIHHVALETGDVGAIYTGRDYTFRGNRIMHNYIHDVGGVGMGAMGVYQDDCVSGAHVEGNLFHRVNWGVFLGGGRDHVVRNNLFVNCQPGVVMDARGIDRSPVWRNMVDVTMRERLVAVPLALYRERYPEMRSLDRYYGPPEGPAITGEQFMGVPAENNRVERNVCVGPWLVIQWHADAGLQQISDNFVTDGDPGWLRPLGADPRPTDFAFKRDAPALQHGFRLLRLSKMGLNRPVRP